MSVELILILSLQSCCAFTMACLLVTSITVLANSSVIYNVKSVHVVTIRVFAKTLPPLMI